MEVGGQRKAFLLRVEFTSPVHRLVVLEEAQIVSPFVSQVAARLLCLSIRAGGLSEKLRTVAPGVSGPIHHACHTAAVVSPPVRRSRSSRGCPVRPDDEPNSLPKRVKLKN